VSSRLIRIFNILAAVFIVGVLAIVYWLAIRPIPRTTGTLDAPILAAGTIRRDERGVPHIEAGSQQDLFFLQGYATAQDRLWQMDVLRRFGAGEVAEIFGSAALPTDEQSRRFRMRALAEANAARLSPENRAAVLEYARGVNFYIDTHRGNLSLEFRLPGHDYEPKPWTAVDSMLIGLVMYRDLTGDFQMDVEKGYFFEQARDGAKARVLFPAVQGGRLNPGSNAWAVSGAHTASGHPMLANDPHLAFGIPGTWHMVDLKAPGLHAAGVALPGVPCVISGHNEDIAWGVTNMQSDVTDAYIEQIDLRTGRYVFQGKTEQAILDRQMIGVRGAKPVAVNTWLTRHGPVVVQAHGKAYSLRWSAADGFGFPFLAINRAKTWDEFRAPLRDYWGPGQNFVFADRAGNIGYQATGRMPIRGDGKHPILSDMPLDGASGNAEWTGYIPFDQMPSVFNPPSGLIATANQNPFPTDFPYLVPGTYADRYRVTQIRSLLNGRKQLQAPDFLTVQKDVYSAYDRFLANQIRAAIRQKNASQWNEVADILGRWNGQMDKGAAAPAITQLTHRQMGQRLVSALLPEKVASEITLTPRPQVLERLLRERPSGWVSEDDWNGWLLSALSAGMEEGRKTQGSRVASWRWGRMMQWKITHPVGKQFPFVDRFFDIGPVEMSGSGTTVKQTTIVLGPSERMAVDTGNWDASLQNLPAGESGFVASPHYRDQWNAYYAGKSFPMQFEHVTALDTLQVRPN
jgi:penicillin G amidase